MRSFRQIVLLGAALAALGGAMASAGSALAQSGTGALDGKLRREAAHLAASGFERIGGDTIEAARKDEPSVVPVELDGAATYAVVAACGGGCDHVEIALFDPAQGLLHRSPEKSDVVIVSGPARQSGVHGIGLSVPGCRDASCPVGYVLLRQVPRAAPAGASAAPGAVPSSPQVAAAPIAPAPSSSAPTAHAADAQALQATGELARLVVSAQCRRDGGAAQPAWAETWFGGSEREVAVRGLSCQPQAGRAGHHVVLVMQAAARFRIFAFLADQGDAGAARTAARRLALGFFAAPSASVSSCSPDRCGRSGGSAR